MQYIRPFIYVYTRISSKQAPPNVDIYKQILPCLCNPCPVRFTQHHPGGVRKLAQTRKQSAKNEILLIFLYACAQYEAAVFPCIHYDGCPNYFPRACAPCGGSASACVRRVELAVQCLRAQQPTQPRRAHTKAEGFVRTFGLYQNVRSITASKPGTPLINWPLSFVASHE